MKSTDLSKLVNTVFDVVSDIAELFISWFVVLLFSVANCGSVCSGLIVYVGMMIGAVLWGGLADKLGRRQCLLYALAINCIFSFLSCFAQSYGFFIFFRLCSGIGWVSLKAAGNDLCIYTTIKNFAVTNTFFSIVCADSFTIVVDQWGNLLALW